MILKDVHSGQNGSIWKICPVKCHEIIVLLGFLQDPTSIKEFLVVLLKGLQ
jgi:hypothetical protein